MPLVVRPSPIHAVGVYTTTAIRKGTRVVEYDGERITPEEADRRYDGAFAPTFMASKTARPSSMEKASAHT